MTRWYFVGVRLPDASAAQIALRQRCAQCLVEAQMGANMTPPVMLPPHILLVEPFQIETTAAMKALEDNLAIAASNIGRTDVGIKGVRMAPERSMVCATVLREHHGALSIIRDTIYEAIDQEPDSLNYEPFVELAKGRSGYLEIIYQAFLKEGLDDPLYFSVEGITLFATENVLLGPWNPHITYGLAKQARSAA